MHNQLIHVLMISFPSQGHVNPLLRLANRIASHGFLVTFVTYDDFGRTMRASNDAISCEPVPIGDGFIRFEFIDDELEENDPMRSDWDNYVPLMEIVGRRWVRDTLTRMELETRAVSCLINNAYLPWVSDVAEEAGLPSAVLWPQSCACFLIFYSYIHKLALFPTENNPEIDVEIPNLPLLKWDEIPTFLTSTKFFPSVRRAILEQCKNITKSSFALIDTFYELEKDTVDFTRTLLGHTSLLPIGPSFQVNNMSDSSQLRADSYKADTKCLEWLNGRPDGSVVYISMGTVVHLEQEQMDEIAAGLEASNVSFLWVVRRPYANKDCAPYTMPQGFLERIGDKGRIINFSPQEQVLAHPALACFMTHCGWNSSMEAITSGVPVIAFPHWGDQLTNAKFMCDVFSMGTLLSRGDHEMKITLRDEIERCLRESTSGPKLAEMKLKALNLKALASDAIVVGGSSDINFQSFINGVRERAKGGFLHK